VLLGLYRLERESEADDAPYTIVAIGNSLRKTDIDRTRLEPFPLWDRNFDDVGNQLIRSSRPVPAKKNGKLRYPNTLAADGRLLRGYMPYIKSNAYPLESIKKCSHWWNN
jgi:hypothetical protein